MVNTALFIVDRASETSQLIGTSCEYPITLINVNKVT